MARNRLCANKNALSGKLSAKKNNAKFWLLKVAYYDAPSK